ncbi:MAG: monovalent cation/H(+) antiporter subunit G [Lachnospiraceae bacterium]|nr:monovalent cation/H(+) antiporter subunit G [Candidatus Merdinaster equi]
METINMICQIAGIVFLFLAMLVFVFQIVGIFRYKFLLNKMHVAGMGDTLALFLAAIGLILLSGFNMTSVKLALVFVFMWFTSPTSSHLIAGMEVLTDKTVKNHVDVQVDNVEAFVDGREGRK